MHDTKRCRDFAPFRDLCVREDTVDGIFDRLGNLIRSIIPESDGSAGSQHRGSLDPDMDAAWDELDEFLETGANSERPDSARSGNRPNGTRPAAAAGSVPEALRQDYGNLELPPGAPFNAVRKAYKNLLIEYHPDKHSSSPAKQQLANEITKKINQSFQRIKHYEETGTV